ncbi:MAG: fibronectin type III domain-containing protein [Acidimicrobiaceae bacterium]|nr:fibronectin type III domain-containing protein [Acidimicrobiaceae bacterium]
MPALTHFGSLSGLHRRFWGGSRTPTGRLMRTRPALGRRLRGGTVMFAVLALIAAVLAPTASAQSRTIGTVVLANGWSSADSAVASALAALESDDDSDAVVLYASRRALSQGTADFIEDHQPSEVILIGGTAALSSGVEADVIELVGSGSVRRVEGSDRFDTAAKAVPSTATTFIVANGFSAADTGVAAALAATRTDAAVLLATTDSLTEPTERIILEQQPLAVEFVGGTAVLAESLLARVGELAPAIPAFPRHSGTSRTATAAAAAPNRSTTLVIANGWSPADMGVAAAYAAITSGAAVLYSQTTMLTTPTEDRIRALQPRAIVLIGGSAALDTSLHARLREIAPAATIQRISGSDRIDTAVRAADGALTDVATDPPAAPTAVSVASRNAGLAVSWNPPTTTSDTTSNDDPEVTGYAVQFRACTAADTTCSVSPSWGIWRSHSHTGIRTTTTISGLTNGTRYQVQVRARNSAGLGAWSLTESGTPLAQTAKPSVPSGVTVEAANRLLKVSWAQSIPPKDGTVDGYEVEYRTCPTTSTCGGWTDHSHSGTDTSTTITGLTNGINHEVRVQATSTRGVSGWSPAKSGTPAQLPSFLLLPDLTPGDRQIEVRWNEPADSGSDIRDYDVQYRACTATDDDTTVLTCEPDEDATWGAWRARSHSGTAQVSTITGLTNGTTYEVQLRASNSNGAGPWSDAATATPISVPAKPSTPTVEPGNTKLVVTWTAPSDNGSDIIGYDVERCTGTCANDSDWSPTRARVTTTRHEFTTLANGTAVKVRVRAVNAVGDGPWSSIRTGTPKAVPDAPAAPGLTGGDRKIIVTWGAPSPNGTTISSYEIQYRACTATPRDCSSNPRWGSWRSRSHSDLSDLESTIPSLTNATEYEVRVRARISGGSGPFSLAAEATPLGKPSKTPTPSVTAGDGLLMLTWTPPADNGSDITGYTVQRCESTADCTVDGDWFEVSPSGTPTPDEVTGEVTHTLSRLTNGTTYRVRVLATNGVGAGPWSSTVSGTPSVRPDAPTGLTMNVADRQVGLLWNAANDKGVTITGYDVEYRACEATGSDETVLTCASDPTWGDWKTHPHSGVGITTTITRLTNGTRYEARVRARNTNGPGPWAGPTAPSSGIPLAAASTPTGLTVEAAYQRLSVSWNASAPHGSTITGYVVEHRECETTPTTCTLSPRWGEWMAHSNSGTTTARIISGLTNGTKYQVRVQATSSISGDNRVSGWSQIKSATPAAVPEPPSTPTPTPDDRQISIMWSEPDNRGAAITDYDVEYRACTATPRDCSGPDPAWGAWLSHGHSGASRSTIITSLTNGTRYQVRVRATNANGIGPWLTNPAESTPVGAPAMPATPRVTTGDGQLTVDWIEPRSNGSDIDGYDVEYRACEATNSDESVLTCASNPAWGGWGSAGVSISGTMATIADLTNGTAHQVQVRAKSGSLIGPWSSPVTEMPRGAPDAPKMTLTSGNRKLIVSWPTPNAKGSTITSFTVRYCDTADASKNCSDYADWVTRTGISARATSYTIQSLSNGDEYRVEMRTNSSSHGASEWPSYETATPGAPNAPSTPRLTAGNTEISVTWFAPAKNHSDIFDYEVEHCLTTLDCTVDTNWTDTSHSGVTTSFVITGLDNDKSYRVRVRAQNNQGWGAWSVMASATPTT